MYQLREFLKQNDFKSKNEVLVVDKGIGYEIFLLSKNPGEDIHPVGSSIFNTSDSEHQSYIKNLINYYERKMKSDKSVVPIVNLYKEILL
ncbi:MAG: tRNA (adenine(22)-N(1))-methyltransferase TrmK [Bacteriovoracaceae bacterium]|nr:tRNA (adenine(22)-N(1))-methyltransferase TrmK [Bacteriovoracaceae bacterium]